MACLRNDHITGTVLTESQQRMYQRGYWCLQPTPAPVHPATPSYQKYACSQPAISDGNTGKSTKSMLKSALWELNLDFIFGCLESMNHFIYFILKTITIGWYFFNEQFLQIIHRNHVLLYWMLFWQWLNINDEKSSQLPTKMSLYANSHRHIKTKNLTSPSLAVHRRISVTSHWMF